MAEQAAVSPVHKLRLNEWAQVAAIVAVILGGMIWLDSRFDQLDARIDRLDARQTTRLDRLDQDIKGIRQDIKGIRKDLAVLSERLARVETKFDERDSR